jgi:hypothetical protein
MSNRRKLGRGRVTDFAPNCPDPMHQLVMLAGPRRVKELTAYHWPLDMAVFDALLDLPESKHPAAVRLLHKIQPADRTPEQFKESLEHATEVLYALYFGLADEHACGECKAGQHCDRADPVACWCTKCDPELDDETREAISR